MSDSEIDSSAYVEIHNLVRGHSDTVNALSFSRDGNQLVSGANDCSLLIWDVQAGQLIFRRLFNSAITSVLWHPTISETVIVGCDDGETAQVTGFTLSLSHKYPVDVGVRRKVHCVGYSALMRFLAIGIGSEVHITLEHKPHQYSGNWKVSCPEHDEHVREVHAVSVHFNDDARQVIVSYFAHGIVCYDLKDKDKKFGHCWRIPQTEIAPLIGSSSLSTDGKWLAVQIINRGIKLYHIHETKPTLSGTYEQTSSSVSLQVCFVQGCRGIVSGTTTGDVCIWYRGSMDLFQKLHHEARTIGAIAHIEHGTDSLIATGSAGEGQETTIKIWRARMNHKSSQDNIVNILEKMTLKRLCPREDVRRGLARSYTSFVWLTLAILLAWGSTYVPWISSGISIDSWVVASHRFSDYLCNVVREVELRAHQEVDSVAKEISDWLRERVGAWLQGENSA